MVTGQDIRIAGVLVAASIALGALRLLALPGGIPLIGVDPGPDQESCAPPEPIAAIDTLSADEALGLAGQPGVVFIDARSSDAYQASHVPGALHLEPSSLEPSSTLDLDALKSAQVDPDDVVIVYCDEPSCERSNEVALRLKERGICSEPRTIAGGWQAWLEVGGPQSAGEEMGR